MRMQATREHVYAQQEESPGHDRVAISGLVLCGGQCLWRTGVGLGRRALLRGDGVEADHLLESRDQPRARLAQHEQREEGLRAQRAAVGVQTVACYVRRDRQGGALTSASPASTPVGTRRGRIGPRAAPGFGGALLGQPRDASEPRMRCVCGSRFHRGAVACEALLERRERHAALEHQVRPHRARQRPALHTRGRSEGWGEVGRGVGGRWGEGRCMRRTLEAPHLLVEQEVW